MLQNLILMADDKAFSAATIEQEFEHKFEKLEILGSKRDLLVGQLFCEYQPSFVVIIEADRQYNGKLEVYYKKRLKQSPENVQRYMRVWRFWNEYVLLDGTMSIDALAQYPNTVLDAARRLNELRTDAIQIIDGEVHLNPSLVTEGRSTHLKDFYRIDIENITKNVGKAIEQGKWSLKDKGIIPEENTATDGGYSLGNPDECDTASATEVDPYSTAQPALYEPAPDTLLLDDDDESTAPASAEVLAYPRVFRGKEWPGSQTSVTYYEGEITTDNKDGKYIYRAVNCRVKAVMEKEGAMPQIVVTPIVKEANGFVTIWHPGQYDGTDPNFLVYVYDAQLGLSQPSRFVKTG